MVGREAYLLAQSQRKRGFDSEGDKIESEAEQDKQTLERFYQNKLRGQIQFAKTLSRLSPSASFAYSTSDMADTGIELYSRFVQGVQRFEREFGTWGGQWHQQYHNDELRQDWFQIDAIPTLHMPAAHLDDTIDAVLTDILLLGVFNVLFFMLSYVFFLRSDVT